jgi:hypothetical protein
MGGPRGTNWREGKLSMKEMKKFEKLCVDILIMLK